MRQIDQRGSILLTTLLPLLLTIFTGGVMVLTAYEDFQQSLWLCRKTAFKAATQAAGEGPSSTDLSKATIISQAQQQFAQKGGSLVIQEMKEKSVALKWTTASEVLFSMRGSCSYDDLKKELH